LRAPAGGDDEEKAVVKDFAPLLTLCELLEMDPEPWKRCGRR
jgi:hypothetical protein